MPWQDWVFSISGIVLGASLIPTIRGDDKPALSTGVLTTIFVFILATTMTTMGLWLAAVTNYFIVGAWATISMQKYQQIRRQRHSVIEEIEEEIVHGVHQEEPATLRH